jgi:hypothetical protein
MRVSAISQDSNVVSGNLENVSPDLKDVIQVRPNIPKVDTYNGSIPKDVTYLTILKNIPKEQKLNSNDSLSSEYQATKSTMSKFARNSKQDMEISKPINISKTADQIEKDSRKMITKGDLGEQIVRDIIVQSQKNIDKLNKFNLSKGNRLIKKIEVSV